MPGKTSAVPPVSKPKPVTSALPAIPKLEPVVVQPPLLPPPPPVKEGMAACRGELAALERISPRAFAVQQAEFNKLVRKAAQYAAIRNDVNQKTKEVMDSLYKYKTTQVCQAISWAMMDSLVKKGEGH